MTKPRPHLVSLADALLALKAGCRPVAPATLALTAGHGLVLAADIVAEADVPGSLRALARGYGVAAADTLGASPLSPIPLPDFPPLLSAGDALPPGTDAVLSPHGVRVEGGLAVAIATASPWDDVRRVGEDAARGSVLLRQGCVLGPAAIATLISLGIRSVSVRRPAIAIAQAWRGNEDAAADAIAALVSAWGGHCLAQEAVSDTAFVLAPSEAFLLAPADAFLLSPADACDGRPALRTVALRPGLFETMVSFAPGAHGGVTPPLIGLPARPEARLAALFALVLPLIDGLAGRSAPRTTLSLPLLDKITVTAGLTNTVLLRRQTDGAGAAEGWRVLGAGDLPLKAFAEADAIAFLPPTSEGLPAGALLAAHALAGGP